MAKVMKTMDGNEAAAYVSYAFTEVAGIYPITPSSPMADHVDSWAGEGKKNLFGMPVKVVEMQSEAGAAAVVHGALQAGALSATYTSSQGLLLMIPNMYKMAGELLPVVFHVAARSIATHALSIFGDHQDVCAVRQTGFASLASSSVQETMDLAGVAHLASLKGRVPFIHFFDGFRTSHEIQKIEVMDYSVFDRLIDREAVQTFKDKSLNPETPKTIGTAQNDDIYFQGREAQNIFYEALPDIVADYMKEISKETGREYKPFVYYGDPEAERIIVAMGSATDAIKETIDYLRAQGEKVGLIVVHLYRPFSLKYFFDVLPDSVKKIAVLDRTKEPGSVGEPLFLDIQGACYGRENAPVIVGGRYGLSSKDVNPSQMVAVYKNLELDEPKSDFTIGIVDDVTFKSLEVGENLSLGGKDIKECLFYGLGADGTVGANKNSVKIIGDKTDLFAQAYFAYDSKKSGGYTRSHVRFGKDPIRSSYLVSKPDFVAVSVAAYLDIYDVIGGIKNNGTLLLNSIWSAEETAKKIPNKVKRILAQRKVKFYVINATSLANDIGLGNRTNTIMQSAFFKLTAIIDYDEAKKYMKEFALKSYGKKGDSIVQMNYKAIESGEAGLAEVTVDPEWAKLSDEMSLAAPSKYSGGKYVETICKPMNKALGDDLPVSVFMDHADGSAVNGTAALEKRGVATMVPVWKEDNCIQCNQCAYVCPHSVIRPFLINDEELEAAPTGVKNHVLDAKGKDLKGYKYKIQISTLDCTGCDLCVEICPTKEKSLVMVPIGEELEAGEQDNADYLFNKVTYKDDLVSKYTVKGSQFAQPLLEFHGACPGCGETPYINLATQLYGEHMMIANATGCSSIYGGSAPTTPYTTNKATGHGPAWGNSLFEDNAEFGLGMHIANETIRTRVAKIMTESMEEVPNALKALYRDFLEYKDDRVRTADIRDKLVPILEDYLDVPSVKEIYSLKKYISKKSQWIIGGDGWAYDIGYGGLDHVSASGQDVNILVLDTEVYSNTGGQSSKASPAGSVAEFTSEGKSVQKKDLGFITMTYGNIYVAQINSNASQSHTLKVIKEAEEFPGVSLIIAYSPCIAHGIKGGLGKSLNQADLATKCGYWQTYTYDPRVIKEGKNPIKISCKEPKWDLYEDFLMQEVRYASLKKSHPEHATALFEQNKTDAQKRWRQLVRLSNADYSNEIEVDDSSEPEA